MAAKLKITVMMGGPGEEREVSLRSGAAVAQALRSLGHDVFELDPLQPGWKLPEGTRVVFLALHGAYGEDGTVQAELEQIGVPYTGCGPDASRIAFDKILTKQLCQKAGVPTARFTVIDTPDASWPDGWNPPLVVKPARQGSSVGLNFVDRVEDWVGAVAGAWRYDSRLLVEERIIGRECTVGILDDIPLPLVEVRPRNGNYDYNNKYTPDATEYLCPAPFDDVIRRRVQDAALGAFHNLGGRDYARVDVIVAENGQPVVLEVNTLPGMTETSLLPKAAAAAGISYAQLCQQMVELALNRMPPSLKNNALGIQHEAIALE
jgi:D-alanine-D-alanine ligase